MKIINNINNINNIVKFISPLNSGLEHFYNNNYSILLLLLILILILVNLVFLIIAEEGNQKYLALHSTNFGWQKNLVNSWEITM